MEGISACELYIIAGLMQDLYIFTNSWMFLCCGRKSNIVTGAVDQLSGPVLSRELEQVGFKNNLEDGNWKPDSQWAD